MKNGKIIRKKVIMIGLVTILITTTLLPTIGRAFIPPPGTEIKILEDSLFFEGIPGLKYAEIDLISGPDIDWPVYWVVDTDIGEMTAWDINGDDLPDFYVDSNNNYYFDTDYDGVLDYYITEDGDIIDLAGDGPILPIIVAEDGSWWGMDIDGDGTIDFWVKNGILYFDIYYNDGVPDHHVIGAGSEHPRMDRDYTESTPEPYRWWEKDAIEISSPTGQEDQTILPTFVGPVYVILPGFSIPWDEWEEWIDYLESLLISNEVYLEELLPDIDSEIEDLIPGLEWDIFIESRSTESSLDTIT